MREGYLVKICIPVESGQGLAASMNDHFGSAPYFLIYDTETETFEVISNLDGHHVHGGCHPLITLKKWDIDAVISKGMGARAVQKLNQAGIRAYRAVVETVEEAIQRHTEGVLEEMTIADCCVDHGCH
jgi:predicted Fe-Mo cluster-binding NifX family protein